MILVKTFKILQGRLFVRIWKVSIQNVLYDLLIQMNTSHLYLYTWYVNPLSYSSIHYFAFTFLLICSQPKVEAILAEVLIVKNDIAYGKNLNLLKNSYLSKLINKSNYNMLFFFNGHARNFEWQYWHAFV